MLMPGFVVIKTFPLQQPEPISRYEVPPHLLRVFLDFLGWGSLGNPTAYALAPFVDELMPCGRIARRHSVNQVSLFIAHRGSLQKGSQYFVSARNSF